MTPTPNPTAESANCPWTRHGHLIPGMTPDDSRPAVARCGGPTLCHQCGADAKALARAIRAHGLLSEAAPGEEQIERAAIAIRNAQAGGASYKPVEMPVTPEHREIARAALTAAGVAPQEPLALDSEKVKAWLQREFGSVLAHDPHNPERFWGGSADALCVAYTEGKLTK